MAAGDGGETQKASLPTKDLMRGLTGRWLSVRVYELSGLMASVGYTRGFRVVDYRDVLTAMHEERTIRCNKDAFIYDYERKAYVGTPKFAYRMLVNKGYAEAAALLRQIELDNGMPDPNPAANHPPMAAPSSGNTHGFGNQRQQQVQGVGGVMGGQLPGRQYPMQHQQHHGPGFVAGPVFGANGDPRLPLHFHVPQLPPIAWTREAFADFRALQGSGLDGQTMGLFYQHVHNQLMQKSLALQGFIATH